MKILGLINKINTENLESDKNKYSFEYKLIYRFFESINKDNKDYYLKIINFETKLKKYGYDYKNIKLFLDSYDLIFSWTIQSTNLLKYIYDNKKKFIFFEEPVFNRDIYKSTESQNFFRCMTHNQLGNNFISKYNNNRIRKNFLINQSFFSFKKSLGDCILIINQKTNDLSSLSNIPHEWVINITRSLNKIGDFKILVRDHPLQLEENKLALKSAIKDFKNVKLSSNKYIEEDLKVSKAVITFSSSSAVDALLHGIPVITCDPGSFVYEICEHSIDKIYSIKYPDNDEILKLSSAISNSHFSKLDIMNGECWKTIKQFI